MGVEERLIALRAAKQPTPLHTFLHIYRSAGKKHTYINHMEGTLLLYSYLKPISIPTPARKVVPHIVQSYELQQLAMILCEYKGTEQLGEMNLVMAAIVENEIKEVLWKIAS